MKSDGDLVSLSSYDQDTAVGGKHSLVSVSGYFGSSSSPEAPDLGTEGDSGLGGSVLTSGASSCLGLGVTGAGDSLFLLPLSGVLAEGFALVCPDVAASLLTGVLIVTSVKSPWPCPTGFVSELCLDLGVLI